MVGTSELAQLRQSGGNHSAYLDLAFSVGPQRMQGWERLMGSAAPTAVGVEEAVDSSPPALAYSHSLLKKRTKLLS